MKYVMMLHKLVVLSCLYKEHICGLYGVVKMFCKENRVSIWQWAKCPRESDMGGGVKIVYNSDE